ncbi:hypothetical protein GIB67_013098, partial [Kingdonia uniflora]
MRAEAFISRIPSVSSSSFEMDPTTSSQTIIEENLDNEDVTSAGYPKGVDSRKNLCKFKGSLKDVVGGVMEFRQKEEKVASGILESNFAKGIMNGIKASPAQLNGNVYEAISICECYWGTYFSSVYPRPQFSDLDYVGKVWNDKHVVVRGELNTYVDIGVFVPKVHKAPVVAFKPRPSGTSSVNPGRKRAGKILRSTPSIFCSKDAKEVKSAFKKRRLVDSPPTPIKVTTKEASIKPGVSHVLKALVLGIGDGNNLFSERTDELERELASERAKLRLQDDGYSEADVLAIVVGRSTENIGPGEEEDEVDV